MAPSSVLAPLDAATYLDFVDKEYLAPYVRHGGAAVKLLAVGDETAAKELAGGLASIGDGYQHAAVDAATTRIHMVDQVFAAVARQLDRVAGGFRAASRLRSVRFPATARSRPARP
jgi:hypothetical protein